MNMTEILLAVGGTVLGIGITIIGYFLKRTMESVDSALNKCESNELNIAVLKNDHMNKHDALNKQMADLTTAIRENTQELKGFKEFVYQKLS